MFGYGLEGGEEQEHEEEYRGIIGTRGNGYLFLFHGPPGSGKTLTVEALAKVPCGLRAGPGGPAVCR